LLLAAGWQATRHGDGVLVQVASVTRALRSAGAGRGRAGRGTPPVTLLDEPTGDWMSVYGRTSDVPADVVAGVLAGPPVRAFAALDADRPGSPVAIGRGVVTDGWLGLAAVEVVPSRRREGLAGLVVDRLLEWGAAQGAGSAYLQTTLDNAAALALYDRYGFVTHHRYRYLAPAPDAPDGPEPGRDHAR
jgi:GNAT superfamily N-acetyltransferase